MTTPNLRQELLRLLQTDDEFRNEARRYLLTEELLNLPQEFAEFAQWTRQNFELTNAAIASMQETIASMQETIASMQETIISMQETIAVMQETIASMQAAIKELQEAMLTVQQAIRAMQDQISIMQGRIGNLIGKDYERRLGPRIIPQLRGMLQTRGKRVLKNPDGFNLQFEDLIVDALDNNIITETDYNEILLADFIIGARDFTAHRETMVAEASVTVDSDDVRRARRRADVVAKAMRAPTLAAVVGQSINAAAQALADSQSVLFLEVSED